MKVSALLKQARRIDLKFKLMQENDPREESRARQLFCKAAPRERKAALLELVPEASAFVRWLALTEGDWVFRGFRKSQRLSFWREIISQDYPQLLSLYFTPTPRKALEFFKAVLSIDGLLSPISEYLAPLMSYLKWNGIPEDLKSHAVFCGMQQDPFRQGIISVIPNQQGESDTRSVDLCSDMERAFIDTQAWAPPTAMTLINHHFLFKNTEFWRLAVCLRDFISADGYVYFAGMYYFLKGIESKLGILDVPSIELENIFWVPAPRSWHKDNPKGAEFQSLVDLYPLE